jgi:hypothetical protein
MVTDTLAHRTLLEWGRDMASLTDLLDQPIRDPGGDTVAHLGELAVTTRRSVVGPNSRRDGSTGT